MHRPEVLTRSEVRRIDEVAISQLGIPGIVLMENAGRATAELLIKLGIEGPVLVCCGSGNNAGDGFVVARHLDGCGYRVEVRLWCDPAKLRGDALTNLRILERASIPLHLRPASPSWSELARAAEQADWVVDAWLGTGAHGPPRSPLDDDIRRLNAANCKRLAIDLPSGLDPDSGETPGAVFRADHTATLVARKPGFQLNGSEQYTGEVHVIDIGLPSKIWSLLVEHQRPEEH